MYNTHLKLEIDKPNENHTGVSEFQFLIIDNLEIEIRPSQPELS